MAEIFTLNNMRFILAGLEKTLYISAISLVLSTIIGIVLGVARNSHFAPARVLSTIYIEVVRNIPNLLWIDVVFWVVSL
jgi:putative glutamine transport system permease protein